MGMRRVSISGELLTEMLTEGWQAGGPDEAVRCVKGLLPGARFIGSNIATYGRKRAAEPSVFTVYLFYQHPDWSDDLEEIDVVFERIQEDGE